MKRLIIALLVCFSLAMPSIASAAGDGIDVINSNARDYIAAPGGTLAIFAYYKHLSSEKLFVNGNEVRNSPTLTGNLGIFRPIYFMEAGPLIIDFNAFLPFGDFSLDTPGGGSIGRTQFGDPIFFSTFWFIHDASSMTWLAFTPFFTTPAGNYDRVRGLNAIAGNRWKFQEELAAVKGFCVTPGHNAYVELHLAGIFQTNNDDATNPVTGLKDTKETEAIFKIESHLSYDITKSLFASADYYFASGGKDSFHGIDVSNSALQSHTIGASLGFNITPNTQLMLQYTNDFAVKNGFETQAVLFRFIYLTDLGAMIGNRK